VSRIPTLPVAVAVAITAPIAALTAVAIQKAARRKPPVALVADYGIRNVPERPPLWRTPSVPPSAPVRSVGVDPVPPQDPHAPPTPPNGIRQPR
jgi:hypothetical protein